MLGDPYVSVEELKAYIRLDNAVPPDDELEDVLASASDDIEGYCKRQFNDATAATARQYYAGRVDARHDPLFLRALPEYIAVDDFSTEVGLIVETDEDQDGTFETVWDPDTYVCEPLNGVVDGQPGWPFWTIRAVTGLAFPVGRRPLVRVTARWGWAAVPRGVKQACKIVAAETFKLREAPFGTAGFGEFGVVRVRDNPMAKAKLEKFGRDIVAVG